MTPVSGIPVTVTVVRKSMARFFPGACELAYESGASAKAAHAVREIHLMLYPDCWVEDGGDDGERRLFRIKRNPQDRISAPCGATSRRPRSSSPAGPRRR